MKDEVSTELVSVEPRDLSIARDPKTVLAEAKKAADALHDVVSKKKNPVIMNKEQYLEFEDWQTVAKFYGVTVKVVSTAPISFPNGVMGFEAAAVAYHIQTGQEISRADSMCLNDEEKWRSRPKYKYLYVLKDGSKQEEDPPPNQIVWVDNPSKPGKKMPKRERTLVGEESVPLFQLRSMAETRACSRVLRQCFSWVVVLAGYKPTPAEEMTGDVDQKQPEHTEQTGNGHDSAPKQQNESKPAQETKKESAASDTKKESSADMQKSPEMQGQPVGEPSEQQSNVTDLTITEEQRIKIFHEVKKYSKTQDDLKSYLMKNFQVDDGKPVESTKQIKRKDMETVLAWIRKKKAS